MSSKPSHKDYERFRLDEQDAPEDPIQLFQTWYEEAERAGNLEPESMVLATAAPDGQPSARVVLLRGVDQRGFVFFTNYESRKAEELAANPKAALVVYWQVQERQVRIEGRVALTSAEESDAYFRNRPRASQLGAWASEQSRRVPDRQTLEARVIEFERQFEGKPVPRPPFWGGYRLVPEVIEFWQGRAARLHDRLRYYRRGEGWSLERLAP